MQLYWIGAGIVYSQTGGENMWSNTKRGGEVQKKDVKGKKYKEEEQV